MPPGLGEPRAMGLIWDPRFRGLFWTQALGAFNDNFFKQALLILVVFKGLSVWGLDAEVLPIAAGALFMLPFFLFSATGGQLSDKLDKSLMIRRVKLVELVLAVLAVIGLSTLNLPVMLVVLTLLGLQSTFFGPIKYGILPQLLKREELVRGNALIETATKLAILTGTMIGGYLATREGGVTLIGVGICIVACLGYATARMVPAVPPADPDVKVEWNPVTPTWRVIKVARETRAVFLSILGISWFWLLGGSFMGLFPFYGKSVLGADGDVVTMFNAVFSIGVGVGAMLCNKFSYDRLELGLVPFGSIGISVFVAHLAWLNNPMKPGAGDLLTVAEFAAQPGGWMILADLLGLAIFSGFFIIPLYTVIQQRTPDKVRARVIAANNIINALFFVGGSLLLMGLLQAHLTIVQVFWVLALGNIVVAVYIYTLIPEFFLRFVVYLLTHVFYRLRTENEENIPYEGGGVIVPNHVSWIDWLLIAAAVPRPVRFVMWYEYFNIPLIRFLFRDAKVIPIAPAKVNETILEEAYDQIAEELDAGHLVCIFPEGSITKDGEMRKFKQGVERIVARTKVPVVPTGLGNLWGSFFSRFHDGSTIGVFLKEFRKEILVKFGEPVPAEEVEAEKLRARIQGLLP